MFSHGDTETQKRTRFLRVFVFLWLILSVFSVRSEISAAVPQEVGASRTALATIADAKNRIVVDVTPDDVIVQEEGKSREILDVRVADYPVIVMLDTGADARADLATMKSAVERFVDRLGPRPIAIGTFSDPPRIVAGFDDAPAVMKERLKNLAVDPMAKSALMEGAALAGRTMTAAKSLFSAIVILSSTASDASRGNPDNLLASIVDSHAILHVIANRVVQVSPSPGQLRTGPILRSLADQTRGGYTVIYSPASYGAALDRLAERLVGELMVEYLVPAASKPVDVKVGVRLPGARIRGLGVAPR